VQIGVTSWGPEVMDGLCGVKPLPDVAQSTGSRRIGHTATRRAPKLGGARVRVSYRWQATSTDHHNLKRGRRRTLKLTNAIYRQAGIVHPIACLVTARSAGGTLELMSGSIHLIR
jgi:hypothetical protein